MTSEPDAPGAAPAGETAGGVAGRAGAIGVALILASGLGFLLLALVGRWLSRDDNAAFLSLWGLVFGFGSVISAIEQEIARQATAAALAGRRTPGSVAQLAALALGACVVVLGIVAVLPLGRSTLQGSAAITVLAFVALAGFTGQFLARGVFLGSRQTGRYVAVLVAEAALRVLLAAVLFFGGVAPSLPLAVACIVVGCLGWLPLVPALARSVDWRSGHEPWRAASGRVGALALANGLSSLVLTAFPTLVTAVVGASDGLADLFGVVTVSRIPLVLVSPLQALTVPLAVQALHTGRVAQLGSLQVRLAAGASAAAVGLAGAGWLLGPWAMGLFLGEKYAAVSPALVAWVLATSALLAAALLQAAVFIALERYRLVVLTWALAVAAAVAALLLPGAPEARGMAAFVAASVVAFGASGVLLQRAVRARITADQA